MLIPQTALEEIVRLKMDSTEAWDDAIEARSAVVVAFLLMGASIEPGTYHASIVPRFICGAKTRALSISTVKD